MFFTSEDFLKIFALLAGTVLPALKLVLDRWRGNEADKRLDEAEKQAFQSDPEAIERRTKGLIESHGLLEQQAKDIAKALEESRSAVQMGRLFNVYSRQIEKYQTQTQSRAGWSFMFALLSMVAGLGFIVWGGSHIIANPGWQNVTAGTVIAVIGGAVSAFITKTFLDVHRLSLLQLNHYFRQPVLNTHILTAQRLADQLPDAARQKAYVDVIDKVAALIRAEPEQRTDIYGRPISDHSTTHAPARASRGKKQPVKAVVTDEQSQY